MKVSINATLWNKFFFGLLKSHNIYPYFMEFEDWLPCSQQPIVSTANYHVHSNVLCPQQPTVFTGTYCVHSCSAANHVLNHLNPWHILELLI